MQPAQGELVIILTSEQAEALGIFGVDVEGAPVAASGQAGDVVHPAVVRPLMAAADQDQADAPGTLFEA